MSEIYSLIFIPFAWVLRSLYFLLNSYGLAIIVFCLITKVILFPLSLMGKKSMIKMNALSSKQQQLQRQFGKDKARLNLEMQKLYDKEKVNPMGGCLWTLLPLPILIGLYGVIRQPLHYMMGLTSDEVSELSNFLYGSVVTSRTGEITIAEELFRRFGEVLAGLPNLAGKLFSLDVSFLGINLAQTPQWNPMKFDSFSWNNIGLFLIPIVSAVLAYFSMQISLKTNSTGNSNDNPIANNKSMMYSMPLISLWIGFTMPAALGIYWIANSVLMMLQELLAGRILRKDFEAAAIEAQERERQEKEEEKEKRRLAAEVKAKAASEGKKRQVAERKTSGDVLVNSRVGIRAYARGRAYEPNRFGGVTPYRDPSVPVDEAEDEVLTAKDQQELESQAETVQQPGTDAALEAQMPVSDASAEEEATPAPGAVPAQNESRPADNGDFEAEAAPEEEEENKE